MGIQMGSEKKWSGSEEICPLHLQSPSELSDYYICENTPEQRMEKMCWCHLYRHVQASSFSRTCPISCAKRQTRQWRWHHIPRPHRGAWGARGASSCSTVPTGSGSKAGSERARGATGTAWACLVHVLNYAIEKQVNVLNILELFLTCLFRKQISISYYIVLLNYLFTAQNTCIICASCYYNPKLMFIYFSTYVVEIALWLYQLAFFFFFFSQRNLFQSNF